MRLNKFKMRLEQLKWEIKTGNYKRRKRYSK